jgi:hypothetical protein
VLVGGAPLNEEFGKAIGADAYCRDAAVAVETAKEFVARKHNQHLEVRPLHGPPRLLSARPDLPSHRRWRNPAAVAVFGHGCRRPAGVWCFP